MIDKANMIYSRWSNGQELPTVLRHITDDVEDDDTNLSSYSPQIGSPEVYIQGQDSAPVDTFARAHQSLGQCIAEVHQRARALFPHRKPCQCTGASTKVCPPSHDWSPPPAVASHSAPVLPEVPPPLTFMSPSADSYRSTQPTMQHSYHPGSSVRHPTTMYGMTNMYGEGLYTNTVLPVNGHSLNLPSPHTLPSTSKMAVVDTINFELGALNANGGQNWMAFF